MGTLLILLFVGGYLILFSTPTQKGTVSFSMNTPVNFEEEFSHTPDAIIANNCKSAFIEEDFSAYIRNLVFSNNKGEEIGFEAECACGFLKRNNKKDFVCPQCGEKVKSNFVTQLNHNVWITAPLGIKAFLHPTVYDVLKDWMPLTKGKGNLLDCILNVKADIPEAFKDVITGQGFNYFYDNFDYIMDYLCNVNRPTATKKQTPLIKAFIATYRDIVFTTKLPILSSDLHPITRKGKTLSYVDNSCKSVLETIIDLANIQFARETAICSDYKLEAVTFRSYKSYLEYLTLIHKFKISKKPAVLRKHVFATRCHQTIRAVISPNCGVHDADEIHIPWKLGVISLTHQIINKLINRTRDPMSLQDAYAKVKAAEVRYDHEIDLIMQKLIDEAAHKVYDPETKTYRLEKLKGIPILLTRNPTMKHGSIQLLFITRVKPCLAEYDGFSPVDIDNSTIELSTLILKSANADFDKPENSVEVVNLNRGMKRGSLDIGNTNRRLDVNIWSGAERSF